MTTRYTTGKHFMVRCGEGGVFLGRALGEPHAASLLLEGRSFHSLHATRGGGFAGTPFTTSVEFLLHGGPTLHGVEGDEAVDEAQRALSQHCTRVDAARFPLLSRWFEAALLGSVSGAPESIRYAWIGTSWVDSFELCAEEFRRTLLRSPRPASARELDRLTELEGDLVIELGKVANDVGVELASLAVGDGELARFLEQLGDATQAAPSDARGWSFLSARLYGAKVWARERGRTALVRELTALIKDLISRLCEVALEHDHALDVLISETFASRGSSSEPLEGATPAPLPRKSHEYARPETTPSPARRST